MGKYIYFFFLNFFVVLVFVFFLVDFLGFGFLRLVEESESVILKKLFSRFWVLFWRFLFSFLILLRIRFLENCFLLYMNLISFFLFGSFYFSFMDFGFSILGFKKSWWVFLWS